jgi:hypothetical protein
METCRLRLRSTDLLDDGIALFGINDPLSCPVLVFVSGDEQEPGRVRLKVHDGALPVTTLASPTLPL